MRSRLFRCLICALLVAALIVQVSPLRAEASAAVGVAVGVGIAIAVAAALPALGIRPGSDTAAYQTVVQDCAGSLASKWALDGMVTMLSIQNGGVTRTYASRAFLQDTLDYLYSSEVVSESSISFGYEASGIFAGIPYDFSCSVPFVACSVCFYNGSTYNPMAFLVVEGWPEYYYLNGSQKSYTQATSIGDGYTVRSFAQWFGHSNTDAYFTQCSGWYDFGVVNAADSDSFFATLSTDDFIGGVSTTQDLTLEAVGQDIETDYETYVAEQVVDDEGIPYLPVRIPSLATDVFVDQTQALAQTGETAQEIIDQLTKAESIPGVGTESDTIAATVSDILAAVKAIPTTITDYFNWAPPSDHTQFALADLSKFFPFCIPFDLFDFFQLLNADPVAPVFSWEIQDLSGQTYSLTIDLAEWEPVAQLFRRLQLFLFICGLAAASRKYIKW